MSTRLSNVLRRIREAGCEVVLCTGRSRHAAQRVSDELGGLGYGIVLNGAVILNWAAGEIIRRSLLSASAVQIASGIANEHNMGTVWLGVEDANENVYAEGENALWRDYEIRNRARIRYIDSFADLPDSPASLAAYGRQEQAVGLARAWRQAFGRKAIATAGPTALYSAWYTQLTTAAADKGKAAAYLAKRLGIAPEQSFAIGDHENDVGMLRWAGLGVCMGDGHPVALSAADHVTGTMAEDGAVCALERFVLNGH